MAELTQKINTGYVPHVLQRYVHDNLKRFNVLVCHRRFGKTVLSVNALIDGAVSCDKERGRFAYVAPMRKQSKEVAWDLLKAYAHKIPGVSFNESELRADFAHNGARITLYGADNPDSMRGIYMDGCVMDEVAQMKPEVWGEVVRPMLADRLGWVIFIGTPKGINQFYTLYHKHLDDDRWFVQSFPVAKTLKYLDWLSEDEVSESRGMVSDAQGRQEWDCDWNASSDDTLITIDMVTPARGRHLRKEEYEFAPMILGVDPARFGNDDFVIMRRQGLCAFPPLTRTGRIDSSQGADFVMRTCDQYKPDAVFIDPGEGTGVIDRCRRLGYNVQEVRFGGSPKDKLHYSNKRIEMWDSIAKWIRDGGALPDHEGLIADLVSPTYKYGEANGKKQLESKREIKKRLGRSPNWADALALTFAQTVNFERGGGTLQKRAYSNANHNANFTNDYYDPFA